MGRIKDLTGQRFGKLMVLEITDKRDLHNFVIWGRRKISLTFYLTIFSLNDISNVT